MTKIEYLKFAVKNNWLEHLSWIFAAFSLPVQKETANLSFGGRINLEPWGYSTVNGSDEPIRIEDSKAGQPLFSFKDELEIDPSWFPNVKGKTKTTVGNVVVNSVAIVPAFGKNLDYIVGPFLPSDVEARFAPILKSDVKEGTESPDEIYVKNMNIFSNRVSFLEALTTLACWSATEKAVTAPPGITQFKAELAAKHVNDLHRPEVLSEIQDKLQKYDNDYLAGDPAEPFMNGKFKNTSRKKMYQMVGAGLSFRTGAEVKPIIRSLDEGWALDPSSYADMLNDQRFGSFARGAETINGGVAGKIIIRVLSGYVVVDGDCGSTLGIDEQIRPEDVSKYIGRSILQGNKSILLKDKAEVGTYVGKAIQMRSPRTCKSGETQFCRICSGENLFRFKHGLVIPGTEISNTILYANMKMMHSSGLKTKELDVKDAFSPS